MLGKIKSILIGKKPAKPGEKEKESTLVGFKRGINKLSGLISDYFTNFTSDLKTMKEKSRDLLKTNVNLGLKHLNNDKIGDAIFRFKIVSILWPNHVKTHYYLAHCYILQKKYDQADKSLQKLLTMDPSYDLKVKGMINKIKEARGD